MHLPQPRLLFGQASDRGNNGTRYSCARVIERLYAFCTYKSVQRVVKPF